MAFDSPNTDDRAGLLLPQLMQSISQGMYTPYPQLSDLRTATTRKRSDSSTTTALAFDTNLASNLHFGLHQPTPLEIVDACSGCVLDCDDKECQTSKQEQCSDQCVVLPCNDTCNDHCEVSPCNDTCVEYCSTDGDYQDICLESSCRVQPCKGGTNCAFGLEEYLQCCTDFHGNFPVNLDTSSTIPQNWNSLGNLLNIHQNTSNFSAYQDLTVNNGETSNAIDSDPFASLAQDGDHIMSSACTSPKIRDETITNNSFTTTSFPCRWDNCAMVFGSMNELVGHVNLTHLHPPTTSPQPPKQSITSGVAEVPLLCRWDDCHSHSDLSTIPGPSTGLQTEVALNILSSHLFQDHLGVSVPHVPTLSTENTPELSQPEENMSLLIESSSSPASVPPEKTETQKTEMRFISIIPETISENKEGTYATPEPSPPPLSESHDSTHDCASAAHVCYWDSCNASFKTCTELTEHLTINHVGSGKRRYDCHWGNCPRNGTQGFASKQKILRHLQAHTGHRPFVCTECGQHFSEAATLQQHMRRHTKEKPYVCDFPGCGKAFAITGALTIHKRTHNGERPFKCPHCERAFSESSNLSKHLRTHTGDRPYHCVVPGCGKAFARPDQLQRHSKIHLKPKAESKAKSIPV